MPVESLTNKVTYAGDDLTTVFAYAFKIYADAELTVEKVLITDGTVTTLTLTTDYTVSGAGESTGGNVTLLVALAATYNLVIRRVLPLTQVVDPEDNTGTPAATVEEVYDRIAMIHQQLQEQIDRSILADPTQTTAWVLPSAVANKFLAWNSAATALENKTASDLSAVAKASSAQAIAGTNDDTYMTPAKVISLLGGGGLEDLVLGNTGTGNAVYVSQDQVLAANKHAVYIYSNSIQVNSDSALLKIAQDNASSTQGTISIKNDGSGEGITLTQGGNGKAINITSNGTSTGLFLDQGVEPAASAPILYVRSVSAARTNANSAMLLLQDTQASTEPVEEIINGGTGSGLLITQSGNGIGLEITNAGTEIGLSLTQNGNGQGIKIFNNGTSTGLFLDQVVEPATNAPILYVRSVSAARTNANSAMLLLQDTQASTEPVEEIINGGTGSGLLITQSGNGIGLDIDSEVDNDGIMLRATPAGTSPSTYEVRRNDDVTGNIVLKLGSGYLWVDTTGDLRIHSAAPDSDTAGTVVGTQS